MRALQQGALEQADLVPHPPTLPPDHPLTRHPPTQPPAPLRTPHPTPQAMHSMADGMEGLLKKGGAKELERRHPAVWKPRLSGGY